MNKLIKDYMGKTIDDHWPIVLRVSQFHRIINVIAYFLVMFFVLHCYSDGYMPGFFIFCFVGVILLYISINGFVQKIIIDHSTITVIQFLKQPKVIKVEDIKEVIIRNEYSVDMYCLYSSQHLEVKVNTTMYNARRFIEWCTRHKEWMEG